MAMNFKTDLLPETDEEYSIGQDEVVDASGTVTKPQKHWKFFGRLFGTATQVSQPLTIGNKTYNGSAAVNIPVYDGTTA